MMEDRGAVKVIQVEKEKRKKPFNGRCTSKKENALRIFYATLLKQKQTNRKIVGITQIYEARSKKYTAFVMLVKKSR